MRPILLVLPMLCMAPNLFAQYVYTIKADSVKITNHCDTAELILENHTQNVLGFLYNKGKGRTEFRKILKLNDSTLLFGEDTLVILGAITAATNGVSLFGNEVRLGQTDGDSTNPAILTEDREIPTNGYMVKFTWRDVGRATWVREDEIYLINEHGTGTEELEIGLINAHLNSQRFEFTSSGYGNATYARNYFAVSSPGRGISGETINFKTRLTLSDQTGGAPSIVLGTDDNQEDMYMANDNGTLKISSQTLTPSVLNVNIRNERVGIMNSNPSYALDVTGSGNFADSLLVGKLENGSTTDSIVVWDNSSKVLKKISQTNIVGTINRQAVNDANYTATTSNYLIAYISITTGRTVTLPTASSMNNKTIIIKDESGSAGTHNITIDGFGSETIDGSANKVINTNFGSITMYSNGADWLTIHQ